LLGVDEYGARVETIEIQSRAVGERLPTTVVTPADVSGGKRGRARA
jgi:hypothetical protein